MGAEAAFDYNDPSCGKKINELTKDSLKLVFDCISEGSSPEICCAAVSSSGGKVAYLLPAQHSRKDVESLVRSLSSHCRVQTVDTITACPWLHGHRRSVYEVRQGLPGVAGGLQGRL